MLQEEARALGEGWPSQFPRSPGKLLPGPLPWAPGPDHGCPPAWDISAEAREGGTAPLRLSGPQFPPQPCSYFGLDFGPCWAPDKKREASLRRSLDRIGGVVFFQGVYPADARQSATSSPRAQLQRPPQSQEPFLPQFPEGRLLPGACQARSRLSCLPERGGIWPSSRLPARRLLQAAAPVSGPLPSSPSSMAGELGLLGGDVRGRGLPGPEGSGKIPCL